MRDGAQSILHRDRHAVAESHRAPGRSPIARAGPRSHRARLRARDDLARRRVLGGSDASRPASASRRRTSASRRPDRDLGRHPVHDPWSGSRAHGRSAGLHGTGRRSGWRSCEQARSAPRPAVLELAIGVLNRVDAGASTIPPWLVFGPDEGIWPGGTLAKHRPPPPHDHPGAPHHRDARLRRGHRSGAASRDVLNRALAARSPPPAPRAAARRAHRLGRERPPLWVGALACPRRCPLARAAWQDALRQRPAIDARAHASARCRHASRNGKPRRRH